MVTNSRSKNKSRRRHYRGTTSLTPNQPFSHRKQGGKKSRSLRKSKKRKSKKTCKRRSTKKIQKGGVCRQNEICLFIKSHGSSNRKNFIVPQNMTINFYTPKGHDAPASYNDIRDICYDIDLHANQLCETLISGQQCSDYKLTPFAKEAPDIEYYTAKKAGLYECPPFYPNNDSTAGPEPNIIRRIDGETTLSFIINWIEQTRHQEGHTKHIQVNCNFCRGTIPTTSNKFFRELANNTTNRYTDDYNAQLRQQFDTNMGMGMSGSDMMDTS